MTTEIVTRLSYPALTWNGDLGFESGSGAVETKVR